MSCWSKDRSAPAWRRSSKPSRPWAHRRRCRAQPTAIKKDRPAVLYNLLAPLAEASAIFNIFRYLTFRSGGAVMTALLVSFLLGPHVIAWLKSKQPQGQPIRIDGPESHLLTKKGTPTMGGVLILL